MMPSLEQRWSSILRHQVDSILSMSDITDDVIDNKFICTNIMEHR